MSQSGVPQLDRSSGSPWSSYVVAFSLSEVQRAAGNLFEENPRLVRSTGNGQSLTLSVWHSYDPNGQCIHLHWWFLMHAICCPKYLWGSFGYNFGSGYILNSVLRMIMMLYKWKVVSWEAMEAGMFNLEFYTLQHWCSNSFGVEDRFRLWAHLSERCATLVWANISLSRDTYEPQMPFISCNPHGCLEFVRSRFLYLCDFGSSFPAVFLLNRHDSSFRPTCPLR